VVTIKHRLISTSRLNPLLGLHLKPIYPVVFREPQMKSNLEDGFTLICFQRLSKLNVATEQCPWQDNSFTRGLSFSVLSY